MIVGATMPVYIATVIALVTAIVSPMTGLIALAVLAPIPRPLVIPAPGLYVAMIGAILLGAIFRLPIERPRLRGPSPEVLLLGAFLLFVATQFLGGSLDGFPEPRGDEIGLVFASFATGVLAFIAASAVLRGRSPYPILTAVLVSGVLAAATALAQSAGAEGLFGDLIGPSGAVDRMTGPFGDPNYFGAFLSIVVTLAVACAVIARPRWVKVLALAIAGFVLLALLLTLSRGGIVSLGAGLVVLSFTRGRKAALVTIAAMVLVVAVAYPRFAEVRYGSASDMASRGVGAQIDSSDRTPLWMAGTEVFLAAPIFGVGYGRVADEIGDSAHSWYVTLLAETGVAGTAMWALFILAAVVTLHGKPRPARTVGYSTLAAWMAASVFLDTPNTYQATGPLLITLAAALWSDWAPAAQEALANAPDVRRTRARNGSARAA
jgi:O-antigen ligase